jgi:phenylpropionate dioxygenase-like ring-hydroxylating dioxygenase large terminal subunit
MAAVNTAPNGPPPDPQRAWWPLALSHELTPGRALARRLHGLPLALWRDAQGRPVALHDCCPHRQAPLSAGRVCAGAIQCPYHGWRFDAAGRCIEVPGLPEQRPGERALVPARPAQEAHGLVWVCGGEPLPAWPPPAPAVSEGVDSFFMTGQVRCGLADAAENFLDGFHTHFVHAGLVRRDTQRQTVRATVQRLPDGIEARYSGEGLQSGLVSRWLEGSRSESLGRFRWPGLAEIEYRGARGLNLLVSAWFTPEDAGVLRLHARVATRRGWLPAALKRAVLRPLFGVILRQDQSVLERAADNAAVFQAQGAGGPGLNTALDLLGPSIRELLAGRWPDPAEQGERVLWL